MTEQLTHKGTSRHTNGMPENDHEVLKKETLVEPGDSLIKGREKEKQKPSVKEIAKERNETGTEQSEQESVTKEIESAQETKETADVEFEEIIKDVPHEEISFYKGLWDSLKTTFSDKNELREAIIDDATSHQKRVYSIRGIKDISTLKSYTNTTGDLFQRYTGVFKKYAFAFEGSYRNEFGEGEFSGSAIDLLDRARHEYVAKVKKIVEKARWTRDFNAAQIALSNIEDEVTTRQLQLQQLNPDLTDHSNQDHDEKASKDDHIIAKWPVVNPVKINETTEVGGTVDTEESDQVKGKLGISREEVEKNAAIKDDNERVEVGAQVLKKFEEEEFTPEQKEEIVKAKAKYLPDDQFTSEQKEEIQREAIKAAHHVGGEDKEAHIYNYSHGQLREKYEILQKAGYSKDQIRVLMEHGVVGYDHEDDDKLITIDADIDAYKARTLERDRVISERSSGNPQFPSDTDSIEESLRKIALNTGLTVEEARHLKDKLDTLIDINAEQWRVLMKCERIHPGYLKMLSASMDKVSMDMNDYIAEARNMEKAKQVEREKKGVSGTTEAKEKVDETLSGLSDDPDTRRAQVKQLIDDGGDINKYFRNVAKAYEKIYEGKYPREVFGRQIPEGATASDVSKAMEDYFNEEVKKQLEEMISTDASVTDIENFLNSKSAEWQNLHRETEQEALRSQNQLATIQTPERNRRTIQNIEQLAQAIMDTHPDFGPGTPNELINSETKDGRERGELNQANFMKWIENQLMYYHDQDPDNPQVNFFSKIDIDVPELFRAVNIFTMTENPGLYFKNQHGVELTDLKNEVTNAVWLWGDIRNKDIAYRLVMPMDEEIGKALMNMYQNNVLTKMMGDGTPPIHWILNQAEQFGSGDKKVGMAILESLLIYYNLTDFPELYYNYAGKDSPLFNLNEIEKTIQELVVQQNKKDTDSYLTSDKWARLRGWFDADGNINILDDPKKQVEFVEFFNIYAPEQDPNIIGLVRELVKKTVQQKLDINSTDINYSEQFAQFFLRFTLAAARADLGAPAMDAGEKAMRLYLHEKGPNATNPGYGNIKAVTLRRALGLDFFAGTYVLAREYKNHKVKELRETPYIISKSSENGREQRRNLADDEEVLFLQGEDIIFEDENGHKWIKKGAEDKRKFYEDRADHPYHNETIYNAATISGSEEGRDRVFTDEQGNVFDEAKIIAELNEKYNKNIADEKDKYEIITRVQSRPVANNRGKYQVKVQVLVRKWNTDEYVEGSSYKRAIVKRNADGSIQVIQEITPDQRVIIGSDQKLENTDKSGNPKNEQIVFVRKIQFTVKEKKDGKEVTKHRFIELGNDEFYDHSTRAIYKYPGGEENIVSYFTEDQDVKYSSKRYLVRKLPHSKSTLQVMQEMHEVIKKNPDLATHDKVYDEYGNASSQLSYKTDTMRQFSSNHLARVFQMFHEELDKHIFDVSSIVKGWDEKKNRWVFDEAKIQDIFTEQLYKRRRYAYRTYGIDMSAVIRGIAHEDYNQFEDMRVAEHLFGKSVIDTFRQSNGEVDYEYLSTPAGLGNLFKTELIMRLAAEEAQFSDKNFPEKGMALQLKLAYRDALRRAIASDQKLDNENPQMSKFVMDTFGGRKISEDETENKKADDFMKLYEIFVGASDTRLIFRQGRWEGRRALLSGMWDAVKEFVGETFKG